MHIPDGMLDTKTWVSAWIGSAGVLSLAVRHVRRTLSESRTVLMALMAALVFGLQMLNFPVAGGTSGHFSGGAAVAIVLGPWPAVLVMSMVLGVQALLFADGGITALGANILNIAIIGPFVGWYAFKAVSGRGGRTRKITAAFTAAWAASVFSALSAAWMLWFSGRVPLAAALGAMGVWHMIIGLGEGAITAGLVAYVSSVKPEMLVDPGDPEKTGSTGAVAVGLGALALSAAAVSFVASSHPDGLEYVYARLGRPLGSVPLVPGPMRDYVLPGISNDRFAGVLAGLVGVVVTAVLAYSLLQGVRRRT